MGNTIDISQYLTDDNKLNHTLVWEELANMQGFQAEVNRGKRYHDIMEAYGRHKEDIQKNSKNSVPISTSTNEHRDNIHRNTSEKVVKESIKTPITEQSVCDWINKQTGTKFTLTGEQYSSYDAEEPRYIAEIKIRGKHYDDCLIEWDKYMANKGCSEIDGKDFLYIVVVSPNIYVFNITRLNNKKFNYKWESRKLPRNTAFGGEEDKIDKKIGYIHVSQAKVVPCSA